MKHLTVESQHYTKEHDKIRSRTTGRMIEIEFGPQSDGKVPRNPFASTAQQHFAYAHPEKFGGKGKLKEWSEATDFKSLPKKVKK